MSLRTAQDHSTHVKATRPCHPPYLLVDAAGSTRQLATAGGTVGESYDFDAFGNLTAADAPGGVPSTSILYTGQQRNIAIGDYNLRARRYDPASGRFSTRDSFLGYLNAPQTLHGYAYCGGDPVDYYDPSGNSFLDVIVGQAGSIVQGQAENWAFNQSTASVRSGYNIVASEGGLVMGAAGVLGSFSAFVDGGLSATAAMAGINVGERLFSAGVEGVLRWIVDSHEVLSCKQSTNGSLRDRMGQPPANMKNPQAHHDLPQAQRFQKHWDRNELDIEDPTHGRWVEGGPEGDHQKWNYEFNKQWDDFFQEYPNANREQILSRMNQLRNDPRFQ